MYNLFLDDVRQPTDVTWVSLPNVKWTIVRNYKEFCEVIRKNGMPEFVAYDHDLSDAHYGDGLHNDEIDYTKYNEKTGYDCAKWLVYECFVNKLKHPDYVVHSMNPVGAKNIISYVESYNKSI